MIESFQAKAQQTAGVASNGKDHVNGAKAKPAQAKKASKKVDDDDELS